MVLDSSAVIAIFFREAGYPDLETKIIKSETVLIGAPTLFETAMILQRRSGEQAGLADFLRASEAEIVPFEEEHYKVALDAFIRFGKGRHPARLNILDCMSYAVADVTGLPLLYTGDDFAKTDIEAA